MIYEQYKVKRKFVGNAKRNTPTLDVTRVLPDGREPKFILQIVHGFCERKERYYPLMEYIAQNGGMAIIHDLRGHGQIAADTNSLGDLGGGEDIPGIQWCKYCGDIDLVLSSVCCTAPSDPSSCIEIGEFSKTDEEWSVRFPGIPRYLLGFSMGSMIVGIYNAINRGMRPAGVILSGLPHREKHVKAALFGTGILEAIFGSDHYSYMLNKTALTRYNEPFEPEEDSDGRYLWLSNSMENRIEFENDPICAHVCPIGAYRILMKLVRDLYSPSIYEMAHPDTPILCAAGELDPVAGGEDGILDSVRFFRDMGYEEVRPVIYRGMRHEIYRDNGREDAFADILNFIDDTIASAALSPDDADYYESLFS